MNKLLYVHPGTVPASRAWAKSRNIDPAFVVSARQALSNHLHGQVLQAVLVMPAEQLAAFEAGRPPAKWGDLETAVAEHNRIAAATYQAQS